MAELSEAKEWRLLLWGRKHLADEKATSAIIRVRKPAPASQA